MREERRPVTDDFRLKPIMTKNRRRKARRDAAKHVCGVYFFEAIGSNLVKIGRSSNVEKRISEVKGTTGAPDADLAIWGIVECSKDKLPVLERAMHKAFTETRVSGEWFEARNPHSDSIDLGILLDAQVEHPLADFLLVEFHW